MPKFPFFVKVLPLWVAIGWAGAASAASLPSLQSLVQAASEHNAAYRAAKYQAQANVDQSQMLASGVLPKIGIKIAASRVRSEVQGFPKQDAEGTQRSLQASQPLYDTAAWAAYKESKLGDPMLKLALQSAEQNLIIQISQSYFDALKSIDQLAYVELKKKAALYQLTLAKKSFEVGTATITDSKVAQAAADQASAEEIAAKNTLAIKMLALEQATGIKLAIPTTESIKPKALPDLLSKDEQGWVDMAMSNNPLIAQAKLGVDRADLEVNRAKAGHKPTVNLVASYGDAVGSLPSSIMGRTTTQTVVGINVDIPLFAGFAIQNQVNQSVALKDKASADLDNAIQSTNQAVKSIYAGFNAGLASVKALEAAETSAKSALDASELSYKVGVGTNSDVLKQQSTYYQVMSQLSDARFTVLLSKLQLEQAAGTLSRSSIDGIDKNLGF